MLKECVEVFQYQLKKNGISYVVDHHIPSPGTYLLVDLEQPENPDIVEVHFDKKTGKFDCEGSSRFSLIRQMDYYSVLLEMNKPIKNKLIQSNNYLSFSVKKENLLPTGKLDAGIIEEYYSLLSDPYKKYKKKNAKMLYEQVEAEVGTPDMEKLERCKTWVLQHIFRLEQWKIDLTRKEAVKIYFQAPMEEYRNECRRYQLPNIFNRVDDVQQLDGKLYGLSNNNMGLNSKKPYLEHKTRPVAVPYLLPLEEALLQNQFFNYLYSCSSEGNCNIYIDKERKTIDAVRDFPNTDGEGIFLHINKGKNEAEIEEYMENVVYRQMFAKPFRYRNYLELDLLKIKAGVPDYGERIGKRVQVEAILDEVLFSKFLKNNYFRDGNEIKVKRTGLKQSILLARGTIFRWLYLGQQEGIAKVLEQVSGIIIRGSLQEGYFLKAAHQFNLRCSLQAYFKAKGETAMGEMISGTKKKVKEKVHGKETGVITSDDEYYFAVGQLVNYLLSLSKAAKKTHALANPFFNAKKDAVIKQDLRKLFMKYNYDIEKKNLRFNNLYAMVISYIPEEKINQDMILAGYLSSNVIYEKKEEEES